MKLAITIDTEQDNWRCYPPTGHTVESIESIPGLQQLFSSLDAKPTYLITYLVRNHAKALSVFKETLETDEWEIGMDCHLWNTPRLPCWY